MDIPPELQQQTLALITSLVAYLIERAAQHAGDAVDKRKKKWRVARLEFEELFTAMYHRFFERAPHLATNQEVARTLKSTKIADNLFLYVCGDIDKTRGAYAFPPPYDRLLVILDDLRREGSSLNENFVLTSISHVRRELRDVRMAQSEQVDTLARVSDKIDAVGEQLEHRTRLILDDLQATVRARTDYQDGQVTRPWEQYPSGGWLEGVSAIHTPFFDGVARQLAQTAEQMTADDTRLAPLESQLRALASALHTAHTKWLIEPGIAAGRATFTCLSFVYLQLGTLRFQAQRHRAAARLYEIAFVHAAAARDRGLAARARYEKGVALGRAGNHRVAEQYFRESLALQEDPRTRLNLALALQQQELRR